MTALAQKNKDVEITELESIIEVRVLGRGKAKVIAPQREAILIRNGVPGKILRVLTQTIPRYILIDTVDSDRSNFSKLYRKKHLSKSQGDEVNDLSLMWAELREFFDYDDTEVKEWVATPLPILDGMAPGSLLDTFSGRTAVRNTLNKMRYGDFA